MSSTTGLAACVLSVLCVALTAASGPTFGDAEHTYMVKLHNDARDVEAAQNMQYVAWDAGLAAEAQSWTDTCNFAHQKGQPWGENLSTASYSSSEAMTAALDRLFKLWTDEKQYNVGGTFEECCSQTGSKCCHYTQVIWSKSTKLGCGLTHCPTLTSAWGNMENMVYLACYYTPRGNKPEVSYTFDWRPYLPIK